MRLRSLLLGFRLWVALPIRRPVVGVRSGVFYMLQVRRPRQVGAVDGHKSAVLTILCDQRELVREHCVCNQAARDLFTSSIRSNISP